MLVALVFSCGGCLGGLWKDEDGRCGGGGFLNFPSPLVGGPCMSTRRPTCLYRAEGMIEAHDARRACIGRTEKEVEAAGLEGGKLAPTLGFERQGEGFGGGELGDGNGSGYNETVHGNPTFL